jgi:broad specificity phosphatase PhoE
VNLYLIRHANAGNRHEWDGPDATRPLSKKGRRQAEAVADALSSEPIERLLSSPAVRCLQTGAPLAARLHLEVEPTAALAEGAPLRGARKLLDALVEHAVPAALVAHGDVIPDLLHDLEHDGVTLIGAGCAKGSVWQLIVEHGKVVRGVYHGRPEVDELPIGSA